MGACHCLGWDFHREFGMIQFFWPGCKELLWWVGFTNNLLLLETGSLKKQNDVHGNVLVKGKYNKIFNQNVI